MEGFRCGWDVDFRPLACFLPAAWRGTLSDHQGAVRLWITAQRSIYGMAEPNPQGLNAPPPQQTLENGTADTAKQAAAEEKKTANQRIYEAEKKRLEAQAARKERKRQEHIRREQLRKERERLAYWGKLAERLVTYAMMIFLFYMLTLLPWGAMYRWIMYG
jgi:sRNA-binding protein